MQEQDMDVSLKVIVVGNGMVGKTSLITRFARGIRTDQYKKTIGTDFMEKEFHLASRSETVKFMLWDTAGQEMFTKLTRSYYKGAGAVVYAFSTTDKESFLEIPRWKEKVESECGTICSVLVQNKIDLLDEAQISPQEVENLARKLEMKLYRISVRENIQIDDVFEYLAESFLARGGSASLDDEAVGNIADPEFHGGAADNQSSQIRINGNGAGGKRGSITESHLSNPSDSPQSSPQLAPTKEPTAAKSGIVSLEPITQRTGGKKKAKCVIM